MQYRHTNDDVLARLTDISRIVRNAPGYTALPPRLVAELFGRARTRLQRQTLRLLDPCCGSGGTLTVISLLFSDAITHVGANDISEPALQLAKKNLALLSDTGLEQREGEFDALFRQFNKPVHADALTAARKLRRERQGQEAPAVDIRHVDISLTGALAQAFNPLRYDLVFTDLPYGKRAQWRGPSADAADMLSTLLEACRGIAAPGAVVVAVTPRRVRASDTHGFLSLSRVRGPGGREIHFFQKPE